MQVLTLAVPALGNHCHLVHDGRVALVVDPARDLAAVEAAAEEAGVEIRAVADTHVHNDYLSGALGLARRHRADYLLSADEQVRVDRTGVRGGDVLRVGSLRVEVLDTPGHTPHHQSFRVHDGDGPGVLLSGGSLLHGTVGRTDLVDPGRSRELARAQWASARQQAALPSRTALLPTHGFGSFCAGGRVEADVDPALTGLLAAERLVNPALTVPRERFVDDLLAGYGPVPRYYAAMAGLNRAGHGATPARPGRRLPLDAVRSAVAAGAWVADTRARAAFAHAHLPGTVSVEGSPQLATYVGWLAPRGSRVALVGDDPGTLAQAVLDLGQVGTDGVDVHLLEDDGALTGSYRRATWEDFRDAREASHDPDARRAPVLLDVRQDDEWHDDHLPGALHVPVQDVETTDLPTGPLWVHCRSGYRAAIAASLLHRRGHDVVLLDDPWEQVDALDLTTTRTAA